MVTYLLQDKLGYYWIWYRENGKPKLNGPHSEKMLNLPVIQVDNPLSFKPPKEEGDLDG